MDGKCSLMVRVIKTLPESEISREFQAFQLHVKSEHCDIAIDMQLCCNCQLANEQNEPKILQTTFERYTLQTYSDNSFSRALQIHAIIPTQKS